MKKNELFVQNDLKTKTKNIEDLLADVSEKDALIVSLKKENESLKKKIAVAEKNKLKEQT